MSRQRRIGLRVALAVAAGFTWNLATDAVIPFFGPVLAVQFLIERNQDFTKPAAGMWTQDLIARPGQVPANILSLYFHLCVACSQGIYGGLTR